MRLPRRSRGGATPPAGIPMVGSRRRRRRRRRESNRKMRQVKFGRRRPSCRARARGLPVRRRRMAGSWLEEATCVVEGKRRLQSDGMAAGCRRRTREEGGVESNALKRMLAEFGALFRVGKREQFFFPLYKFKSLELESRDMPTQSRIWPFFDNGQGLGEEGGCSKLTNFD